MIEYAPAGATFVFLLTWILILPQKWKALPMGRSVSAIFGAALLICIGVVSMDEAAFFVTDGIQVLILLFGLMILSNVCDKEGFFDLVEKGITKSCKTGASLMLRIVIISGVLSAIITNDAVCIFLTAPIVRIAQKYGLKKTPLLIALGTSANIGSAATLSGNPQNAYIGINSNISYLDFVYKVGLVSLLGLLINYGCLWVYDPETMRQSLDMSRKESAPGFEIGDRLLPLDANGIPVHTNNEEQVKIPTKNNTLEIAMKILLLIDILALIIFFLLGFNLAMVSMGCGLWAIFWEAALLQYEPKPIMDAIDYPLLIFFSGLFIVVGGVTTTGYPQAIWNSIFGSVDIYSSGGIVLFSLIVLLASNMISNVPAVVLATPLLVTMLNPQLAWLQLAWVSTVSGNLTVIGSAAMIIVAERAMVTDPSCVLSTWKFMKYGIPSTIIVTSVGVPILCLLDTLY